MSEDQSGQQPVDDDGSVRFNPPITSTTHILPFERLSPLDFERLCLWLVEREGYTHAEHLGLAGSEQGRDVIAYKPTSQGEELWYFQCKRYRSIRAKTLKDEVDKYLKLAQEKPHLKPFGVVFVVSCAVSADAREEVGAYCEQHNLTSEFWALTELDLRVKRHPDLLREFFNLYTRPIDVPFHPVLCLLNEAVIRIHPDKQLYSMQFTHILKNIGRDPITQVPCPFYANIYPDDPERCLEWYSMHKISWEELKFHARDDFGPLDVELRSDFNAAKDIVVFFSEHSIDRPIYHGEVRTFRRRFVISFQLWGSYLDRAIRDPTDRLRVKIVAPASLRGFRVGGKELSRTGPVAPLQTAPRRTLLGARQVWTWEERTPKLGYTYRLSWPTY